MTDSEQMPARPTEQLMQAWIHQSHWALEEALLLALGTSPDADDVSATLQCHEALLARAQRSGERFGAPTDWLWWAERNNIPFHTDWWLSITPEGPIGYDGQHFAHHRREMLSERYLQQERRLIGKWARKPYWTVREAIDLSLNFDPFTTDGWRGEAPETGETIREREDRFRIFERAMEIAEIGEKSPAKDYLLWLKQRGYYVSPAWHRAAGLVDQNSQQSETVKLAEMSAANTDLQQQLEERDEQLKELQKKLEAASRDEDSSTQKSASTRRIATLQKALIACAVDGHSYDPRKKRSDVPKQIADKSDELGCTVIQQTVRNLLKEASEEYVDRNYWDSLTP